MRRRTLAVATTVAALATTGAMLTFAPSEQAAAEQLKVNDDFNGDGYHDIAIGVPKANGGAGKVTVLYGGSAGVSPARSVTVSQASPGVPGAAEAGDQFGENVTGGDVNRDGYTDLIVGSPYEKVTDKPDGSVTILFGGPNGLEYGGAVLNSTHPDDREFGQGAAFVDLDGDEGSRQLEVVSANHFYYYPDGQLKFDGTDPAIGLEVDFLPDDVQLDGVIPASYDNSNGNGFILYGTHKEGDYLAWFAGGPGDIGFHHTVLSDGGPQRSVALGDIDKDGYPDLVTGQPGDRGQGSVTVWWGAAGGPGGGDRPATVIDQDSAGVPGAGEAGDGFGASVAVRDVTGDGYQDIVAGVPGEDIGTVPDAGAVVLLKGSASGVSASGAQAKHQSSTGVPGVSEAGDRFGAALHLSDVNRNGKADLAVGAPGEDIDTVGDAGAVWVLRGSSAGLTTTNITSFNASDFGYTDTAGLRFGEVFGKR